MGSHPDLAAKGAQEIETAEAGSAGKPIQGQVLHIVGIDEESGTANRRQLATEAAAAGDAATVAPDHEAERRGEGLVHRQAIGARSEEHTSELQSLMRISSAVFCLKNKKTSRNKNI